MLLQSTKFFMVGMPGSGKTTYLAMLSNMLVDCISTTKLYKKVNYMPEGYEYIEEYGRKLLQGKILNRTPSETYKEIRMLLYDRDGKQYVLDIPDLSGEVFRDLVKDRRIEKKLVNRIRETDCILFFINFQNMSIEKRIPLHKNRNDKNNNYDNNTEELMAMDVDNQREANQSEVVELLQTLLELKQESSNIRFVLSAWDKVEEESEGILPEKYVEKKFPLLYQFVKTNSKRLQGEYWGVSAQGGDFDDEADMKRIENEEYEAIMVVDPTGKRSNDLTALLYI